MRHNVNLKGVRRCPHCGIANPLLIQLWMSNPLHGVDEVHGRRWAVYQCTTCGNAILAKGQYQDYSEKAVIVEVYPGQTEVGDAVPSTAKAYLEQAYGTLHAPDAASVMAGSAVDAMLKEKGYTDGSLYQRIDEAVTHHLLTDDMGKWAHEVRLGSNRPRHADADDPHLSAQEAKQSVEFADALAQFLFVLPARVEKGIRDAEGDQSEG